MSERSISDLRVIEISSGVAPAYAAKLLGDQGANVIKLEPPQGDALRHHGPFPEGKAHVEKSGYFIALNVNKQSVKMRLEASEDLAKLLASADILVHGLIRSQALSLGVDPETLADEYPSLVTLSLTPFGATGPNADLHATELTLSNAGGWANLCPATHTDPELPPLKVIGDQCMLMSGLAGATAALAVWRDAKRSGQGDFIDLSMQEYVASVLEVGIPAYSYKEEIATRHGLRALIPWRIFQAKDAPIFIVCVEQDQWERLVAFMGNPDWAFLDTFADQPARNENQDLVHMFVQEFVSKWTAEDLYHAAQKHRICVAPVFTLDQLANNEHLAARSFFETVSQPDIGDVILPGASPLTTSGRAPIRMPAPRLGEHTESVFAQIEKAPTPAITHTAQSPLQGVRVLDMTWAWAGPFCSLNLAHLGADVIRLESALRPDLYRRLPVYPVDIEEGLNCSGMFNQWNQGKTSIAINLTSDEGISLVKQLVAHCDVVVQNFATGVMERLGLDYATLHAINPRVILASVSGYGQTGPYRQYIGYGPAIPPLTGLAAGTGYLGGEAEEIGLSMPDPTAGITAAYAVVGALLKREETGVGEHLDITLWEATGVLNVEAWMEFAINGTQPERIGNRSRYMSPHGIFRCEGEDRWISIACRDDEEWRRLAGLIDAGLTTDQRFTKLADRQSNEDELESFISAWTAQRDRWDLTRLLQAQGIPAFPTLNTEDVVQDPHLNERGFIERLTHPEVGKRAHAGIPWRLRNRVDGIRTPAPCLGADTNRHLADILNLSSDEIAKLHRDGNIGC